jgi:3-oxoacyl-(acyl-carrier-protein) synthase
MGSTSARRVRPADPVAILAGGVVTPIGGDLDAFWSALLTGVDGITPIERFPVADLRVGRGGEIKKLPDGTAEIACRASRLLATAADDLLARAALDVDPARVAVVVGTALGGVEELERALDAPRDVHHAAGALYDAPAHALAAHLGARGPVLTVSTACASGATALGLGADLLRAGHVDRVVAGGYDILCRFVMRGFDALRSLTRETVRPFDRRRSGLLLGEAAALVLMARDGDTSPRLGRLLGHASASDGVHISAPDPQGRGLALAIRQAMEESGLTPDALDLVSAHGTATPLNDRVESRVLREALGARAEHVPIHAIKGGLGHTMGAAATLEAIACLLAARHGVIPHTFGLEEIDPECALDLVRGVPRTGRVRVSLSTSLGFGGCNAALVLEGEPA